MMVTRSESPANLYELPGAASRIQAMEAILGFAFHDRALLLQALLHRSAVIERQRDGDPEPEMASNERLEFLGDAVLNMLIARYAFDAFPDYDEGRLTELRAALVRRSTLGLLADSIDLASCIYMGRSERKAGARGKMTVLAEGLEALVAAIYLDRGLETTGAFVARLLRDRVPELVERAGSLNAKSRLQEFAQTHLRVIPTYALIGSSGPAHDARFTVEVVAGPYRAHGSGTSKQGAEQRAALTLLDEIRAVSSDSGNAPHADQTRDDDAG